jgi:hypothetical protein
MEIYERVIGGVKGSGRGLFEGTTVLFTWRDNENRKNVRIEDGCSGRALKRMHCGCPNLTGG